MRAPNLKVKTSNTQSVPAKMTAADVEPELIGVGRALAPPPSEPDKRYSRIRLSS
jgi:hypothetical protein